MEVLQFGEHPTYLWALTDITERKKYEDELRLQSCVLEKMAEGVNATDATGRIIFSNPALEAMLGYERGTLVGRHVSELNDLPAPDSRAFVGYLRTRGLLTVAAGDNVMRVLPPLIIEESHIREFVDALSAAAADYEVPAEAA
jgi:PAS domain-containing protein